MATTTLRRPRNVLKLQPLKAVGEPNLQPPMLGNMIPEPTKIVGAQSGQTYAMLGDNPNGMEHVQVTPPPGPVTPEGGQHPVSMAGGGDFYTGDPYLGGVRPTGGGVGTNYFYPAPNPQPYSTTDFGPANQQGWGTNAPSGEVASSYMASPASSGAPQWNQQQADWLRALQRAQQQGVFNGQQQVYDARGVAINSQIGSVRAQQGVLPYSYAVLRARQGLTPFQQGVINAQRGVLSASRAELAGQRGVIGQEQANNAQDLADYQALRSAQTNVADQTAVATEQQRRDVENQDYAKLGVSAPVDVLTAPGQEGTVAPGTRARLQTQADIVQQRNTDSQTVRASQLRAAQLAVQLQGTDVQAAQQAAQEAGLSLQEANLLVDQAQNNEQYAQLGARNAGYEADITNLGTAQASNNLGYAQLGLARTREDIANLTTPSDQGYQLYTDPNTLERSWLTPAEADARQYEYQTNLTRSRIPQSYQTQQQATTYANQQQGDLGGLSEDDIVNMMVQGQQPTTGILGQNQDFFNQIVSYYQKKNPGISQEAAVYKAEQLVQDARDRIAAAQRSQGGSGPAPTPVKPPAGSGQ